MQWKCDKTQTVTRTITPEKYAAVIPNNTMKSDASVLGLKHATMPAGTKYVSAWRSASTERMSNCLYWKMIN